MENELEKKPEKKKQCQFEPKIPIPRFFLEAVQLTVYHIDIDCIRADRGAPSKLDLEYYGKNGLSENRILSTLVYHHVPHENCLFLGVWCTHVYPIFNPIFKQTPRVHLSSQGHGLKFQDGYRLTTPARSS